MKIEIYSDVICPWCYIGKRRLDSVMQTPAGEGVELVWRPYQLYPNVPAQGVDRGNRTEIPERIRADAEDVGIDFDYRAMGKLPNTLNAHRLLGYAEDKDCQHELAEVLFRYYFCDGRDVSVIGELAAAAQEVGMDAEAVREYLASDRDVQSTLTAIRSASDVGVAGVPCYRLGGRFMLPGAQTPEVIAQFIERAKIKLGD